MTLFDFLVFKILNTVMTFPSSVSVLRVVERYLGLSIQLGWIQAKEVCAAPVFKVLIRVLFASCKSWYIGGIDNTKSELDKSVVME